MVQAQTPEERRAFQFLQALNDFTLCTKCEVKDKLSLVDRLFHKKEWVDIGDNKKHVFVKARSVALYLGQDAVNSIRISKNPTDVFIYAYLVKDQKKAVQESRTKIDSAIQTLNVDTFKKCLEERKENIPLFDLAFRQLLTELRDKKDQEDKFKFALDCYNKFIVPQDEFKDTFGNALKANDVSEIVRLLDKVKNVENVDVRALLERTFLELNKIEKSGEEDYSEGLKFVLISLMEQSKFADVKLLISALEATVDTEIIVDVIKEICKKPINEHAKNLFQQTINNFEGMPPEKGFRFSTIFGMTVVYERGIKQLEGKSADEIYVSKRHYRDLLDHPILVNFTNHNFFIIKKDKTSKVGIGGFKIIREAIKIESTKNMTMTERFIHGRAGKTPTEAQLEAKEFENLQAINAGERRRGIAPDSRLVAYHGKDGRWKNMYVTENLGVNGWDSKIVGTFMFNDKAFLEVAEDIAYGIDRIHTIGYVHRDLKPGNIVIKQNPDGTYQAVIIDFGLAEKIDEIVPQQFYGTPIYTAPEMLALKENIDSEACDMYAFGVSLYEMSNGIAPKWAEDISVGYNETDPEKRKAHLEAAVTKQKEISHEIEILEKRKMLRPLTINEEINYLIYRLLDPDPTKRLTNEQYKSEVNRLKGQLSLV